MPRRPAVTALLTAAFLAVVYLVFVAILGAWIGFWNLIGSPSALTFFGWPSEPYDNVFVRAAVWVAFLLIVSFAIPAIERRVTRRPTSGAPRFVAIVLAVWVVIVAAHLVWIAFVHVIHAHTDLTFGWAMGELLDNVLIRSAVPALVLTAFRIMEADRARNLRAASA